jgi:hypothetical protein
MTGETKGKRRRRCVETMIFIHIFCKLKTAKKKKKSYDISCVNDRRNQGQEEE